jgi:hypothetical protein
MSNNSDKTSDIKSASRQGRQKQKKQEKKKLSDALRKNLLRRKQTEK